MFGIEAIQIYFPKTFVQQEQYQTFQKVSKGKYTLGLGQLQLSFPFAFQDINSLSLTVLNNLMQNYHIQPEQVGRLEVGTETFVDKSKSTKTVLMTLFQGYHDIEGATSVNACYGAMNALISALDWISSPFWDGRYAIVVAADIASYEDGPARPTGGAGAVAILIGPKGKITFSRQRATYIDHQYDFYKPNPHSEYPIVDGKLSIDCYLKALEQCYKTLKSKSLDKNFLQKIDFLCFHSPFHKMVQKAYSKLMLIENPNLQPQDLATSFKKRVQDTCYISQRIGNIYCGSLFANLVSYLIKNPQAKNKNGILFSYGSGLCSSMLKIHVNCNPISQTHINSIFDRLQNRIKVSPQAYTKQMLEHERNYGNFKGKVNINEKLINDNVFYLSQIDDKLRRYYSIKNPFKKLSKQKISALERIEHINEALTLKHSSLQLNEKGSTQKFYKQSPNCRVDILTNKLGKGIDRHLLETGGLTIDLADTMVQNVIGTMSLPLSVVPSFLINKKEYVVPMCIEEPSVIAAVSSIGKFLAPYSFKTSSTLNVMIGQIHLPSSEPSQIHKIMTDKFNIIKQLNQACHSMVKRGGGVTDLRIRQLNGKEYVVDIFVNVCEAMGANITNMLCQKTKELIQKMGYKVGIAILSNYCIERRALSWFQVPVDKMSWKGVNGIEVAEKIMEAYRFARLDPFRATTHNKGILNGIDAICVATGQDWRAVESAAHAYASRSGKYQPLSHYQIIQRQGVKYFIGKLEVPISVGSIGGVVQKNPLYKQNMAMLGNPNAQELAEIMTSVGLAQNLAALRALAIEGIQKGHMVLHGRTVAQQAGVPKHLLEEVCKYMAFRKKYDKQTAAQFMQMQQKPKL